MTFLTSVTDLAAHVPWQMNGFQEFEARRKRKFDKQLDGNVMLNSKGFDEGVDMKRL